MNQENNKISHSSFVPEGYELVWNDEFEGNELDESKFRVYDGQLESSAGGTVDMSKTPETFSVADSCATMRYFKKKDGTGFYGCDGLKTNETMHYHCGYLEMRAKIPDAPGVYSSFWSNGDEKDFFEIDMFETFGMLHTLQANVHTWPSKDSGLTHTSLDGVVEAKNRQYHLPEGSFSDNFHLFAILWTEEKMEFFCDGHKYYTFDILQDKQTEEYFRGKYQKLIFGFNMGWKGRKVPDESIRYPVEYSVDYIRLYQLPDRKVLQITEK